MASTKITVKLWNFLRSIHSGLNLTLLVVFLVFAYLILNNFNDFTSSVGINLNEDLIWIFTSVLALLGIGDQAKNYRHLFGLGVSENISRTRKFLKWSTSLVLLVMIVISCSHVDRFGRFKTEDNETITRLYYAGNLDLPYDTLNCTQQLNLFVEKNNSNQFQAKDWDFNIVQPNYLFRGWWKVELNDSSFCFRKYQGRFWQKNGFDLTENCNCAVENIIIPVSTPRVPKPTHLVRADFRKPEDRFGWMLDDDLLDYSAFGLTACNGCPEPTGYATYNFEKEVDLDGKELILTLRFRDTDSNANNGNRYEHRVELIFSNGITHSFRFEQTDLDHKPTVLFEYRDLQMNALGSEGGYASLGHLPFTDSTFRFGTSLTITITSFENLYEVGVVSDLDGEYINSSLNAEPVYRTENMLLAGVRIGLPKAELSAPNLSSASYFSLKLTDK